MEEVGHRLSVDVSSGCGQRRVDVSMGVHPHHLQRPDRRCVPVDGADGQTVQQGSKGKKSLKNHNVHCLTFLFNCFCHFFFNLIISKSYYSVVFSFLRIKNKLDGCISDDEADGSINLIDSPLLLDRL